ncbi:MAG TPA: molybdopterin-dependent oxidoreductase, partial [Thermoleophilaceae bacterium]|nr:molybdopterin-dependent oxidoreductase [Thermoleophilaceae bacterium]
AALGALAAALSSPRAGASLDDLARSARASEGFIPGRPRTDSSAVAANNGASDRSAGDGSAGGASTSGASHGGYASGAPAGGSSAGDAVRAVAQIVRDAGDVVIIWGERVIAGDRGAQAGQALLAVADALGVTDKAESGLIGIPAETNGRGLREVGCVGGMGPGLAEASGSGANGDAATAASGPGGGASGTARGALLLFEAVASEEEMAAASGVVAFASFRSEALEAQADVVFPAPVYAEKEGTVTHPDGRLQRVRQALGHPGESRAGWWVLEDLCVRLGAGTGALSAAAVTALVAEAVPFYADLTLEELGGEGVRWQDREAAQAAPSDELSSDPLEQPPAADEGTILGAAPSLWTGPEVDHSPSLRFLDSGPLVLVSPADARGLGVGDGDRAEVHSNGDSVEATVVIRTGVPDGSIFLSPMTLAEGPAEVRTRQEAVAG